jgi:Asp/Glu/hydantoin racemase
MRILFLNQAPKTPKNKAKPHYESGAIEDQLNTYASPGTKIELGFPDDYEGSKVAEEIGNASALNGLHHMMETPAIVRKIVWAAQNGYDAVIQSNTFDPGVDGGRLAVDIPVIGLCRTALHAAATLADRIGITVPLAPHVPYTWRIVRTYGMERFVTGILPIGIYGMDIPQRKAEIFDITVGLIRKLVDETGAEIILPLGGALIPYVVDPMDLQKATGVQVLNTKAIGIRFAEMCVSFGMTQSAITYPRAKLRYEDFTARS